VTANDEDVEIEAFDLTLIVHTIDRGSQKIRYEGVTQEKFDEIVSIAVSTYGALAPNKSLTLATDDGGLYIFNAANVTCVEIRR
jgi:hypothetical protein